MSKSSRQLFRIIIVVSIVMVACVLSVSILMAHLQNDKLMSDRAKIAIGVIKNEIDDRVEEIATITYASNIKQITAAMSDGFDEAKIDEAWNLPSSYSTIFAACYDSVGTMRWHSENCELTSPDIDSALNGNEISGIMSDDSGRLYLGYAMPVISDGVDGVLLLGEDLSNSSILDDIKEQTGAEVTVFSGTTRFATTVINNGQRAVGTEMSKKVADRVITKGETYLGTADVVGKNIMFIMNLCIPRAARWRALILRDIPLPNRIVLSLK